MIDFIVDEAVDISESVVHTVMADREKQAEVTKGCVLLAEENQQVRHIHERKSVRILISMKLMLLLFSFFFRLYGWIFQEAKASSAIEEIAEKVGCKAQEVSETLKMFGL